MTLEEKIAHLQASSMEEARAEGNAVIDAYRKTLDAMLKEYKEQKNRQSEIRIKAEAVNARQKMKQATAKYQLDLKRHSGKTRQELKDKIFEETLGLVHNFMETEAYHEFLLKCIRQAVTFAAGEPVVIYINASDKERQEELEKATGAQLSVSVEDFIGGVRAVIRSRNVLIDNSFKTQLRNEYDQFLFLGGDGIA